MFCGHESLIDLQIAGGTAKLGGAEVVRSGKAMVNQNSPLKLPSVNTSPPRASSKLKKPLNWFTLSSQMLLVQKALLCIKLPQAHLELRLLLNTKDLPNGMERLPANCLETPS